MGHPAVQMRDGLPVARAARRRRIRWPGTPWPGDVTPTEALDIAEIPGWIHGTRSRASVRVAFLLVGVLVLDLSYVLMHLATS